MKAFEHLVDKLRDDGHHVKESGTGRAVAQCPAHEDRSPSLALTATETKVLAFCHAGCETEDVLSALGLVTRDLFNEPRTRYDYADPSGTVLRSVARTYDNTGTKKTFRPAGGDVKAAILYRLPQVVEAVKAGTTVYLVEGEEDVHALEAVGLVATTGPQGANSVGKVDFTPLKDAVVVAVVDKDDAGKRWANAVEEKVGKIARALSFVEAATGKDAADHIAADHGVEDFVELEVEDASPLRRARITWASQIEPEPVVWAWETDNVGRIPSGSLSIAAGREGTGKSSFGIWKAAHITKGTLPGAYFGTPRRVFYVAVEDSWKYTLVPRLMAAGADLSMIGRFEVVSMDEDELTLSLPADNALLEREVRRHEVALVVIDPLMSVIGEKIDTHREREVRSALDPLAKIADRTNSIFLGIAHFNKGGGSDAASLITGSGAFKNVPRTVFGFARDESDESGSRVMSQVKNSLGRDDLPSLSYVIESAEVQTKKGVALTGRFTFTGESDRTVAEILRDSRRDPDDMEEAKDAASWIREYLASMGGEAPAKDVLAAGKAIGYTEKTLKNARRKVASTVKSGNTTGSAWSWILPEGHSEGPEGPTNQTPGPSGPSPGPSALPDVTNVTDRTCEVCGQPLEPGQVRHGPCYWKALQRDRVDAANDKARRSA